METYAQAYTEVLEILKFLPKHEIEKIPKERIDFLEEKKDKNYKFTIKDANDFKEKNFSNKTYSVLMVLASEHILNEEEQEVLHKMLKKNEIEAEKRKKELYDSENIFSKTNNNITHKQVNMIQIEKESFIKKVTKKIKAFFKKQ